MKINIPVELIQIFIRNKLYKSNSWQTHTATLTGGGVKNFSFFNTSFRLNFEGVLKSRLKYVGFKKLVSKKEGIKKVLKSVGVKNWVLKIVGLKMRRVLKRY